MLLAPLRRLQLKPPALVGDTYLQAGRLFLARLVKVFGGAIRWKGLMQKSMNSTRKKTIDKLVIAYVINVDWYFKLHWLHRARASAAAGYEVHIVASITDNATRAQFEQMGFIVHPWAVDRKSINPWTNLCCLLELYRILKGITPILIHAITVKPNICVGLLSPFLRIPYVMSVTGTGIIFSGKSLLPRILRPLVRFFYKRIRNVSANRMIIFENPEDKDYFISSGLCGGSEAIMILGAGVDLNEFQAVPERPTIRPVVLFASRLLWDKGLGDLVEAARLLRQQSYDFVLKVAGIVDNGSTNAIDEKTINGWKESGEIEWLGTVKDMPGLLSQVHVLALPTIYGEGVPRILIEAAASGRAIVATDVPGCREIVRHQINGLLIPPGDIPALAKALATLLKDSELRKVMGGRARERAENLFSEQKVIAETLAVYQKLIRGI